MSSIKDIMVAVEDELNKSSYRNFEIYIVKNLNNDLLELIVRPTKVKVKE